MAVLTTQCVLTLLFVYACLSCVSSTTIKAGKITWDPLPAEPTYKTSTEEPYLPLSSLFGLATGFIHSVPPQEIPWDVLRSIINGTIDVANNYTQFVSYSAGFLTCFAIAIIFMIVMPIIGIVFCCCRCCDNCGGKMLQRDKYNTKCRRMMLMVSVLFFTVLMTFGMICGFTSNAEMTNALHRADSTLTSNVDDILTYVNHTFEQFDFLVYNQYNYVHELLITDLDNVGLLVAEPIKQAVSHKVEPAIESVIQLAKESEGIQAALREMVNTTKILTTQARSLQQALDMERGALNATLESPNCRTPTSLTKACLQLRESSNLELLNLAADFSVVRVEAELGRVERAFQSNITELAYRGKAEYDNITSRINADSVGPIRDVKVQLENVRATMQTEVSKIQTEVVAQANTVLSFISPDSANSSASVYTESFETAQAYDQYRFFVGIALCCVILIVILCNYLGVIFGECGRDKRDRPTERGCLANMGGSLLLTGVTMIFLFSPIIMLATTLSFLAGGATEKAICKPLETGDIFREVIDYPYLLDANNPYWLSAALFQDTNIPLTAEDVIRGCEANGAIYKVMKLDNLFNLSSELNYRQKYPELEKQLDALNVSLAGIKLIDAETRRSLDQFRDSGINSVNYTQYLTEIRKGITQIDLNSVSLTLEMATTQIPNQVLQLQLKSHATNLRRIQEDIVVPMAEYVTRLEQNILAVQREAVNIPNTINRTISTVLNAQDFLLSKGGEIIAKEIKNFAGRLLGYVDQFVAYLLDAVDNDMGRCKPVSNIYHSFNILVCSYTADSLNGFWLALGWCLFFFLPSIILSVKLSKYYRRMRYFEDYFNSHDLESVPMKIYVDYEYQAV